jgi:AcrR family transcriptional regulator
MRRRTQQERRAQADAKMVEAAIELIAERGFGGFVLGEVAARAGYSATLPIHYYKTKEALILHVARRILADYDAAMQTRLAGATGLGALAEFVGVYFDFARQEPSKRRAFFMITSEAAVHGALREEVAALTRAGSSGLAAMIRDGQRDCSIEPLVDADVFGAVLLGWVRGAISLWMVDATLDLDRMANLITGSMARVLDSRLPSQAKAGG